MSVLELRSISKVYGKGAAEVQALRDISLSVPAGTMIAVMGPSGSGKSSLLTIAGTLEEPTSGAVLVNGQDVAAMSGGAKARVRRRAIGYVFQDFNLLPGLTAAENVSLPLELDGMSARRAHLAGIKALEDLGLGDRASRSPMSCPVASGSGWRSPAPWWGSGRCCSRTSRPERSTPPTARPSCDSSTRTASAVPPPWSSPTTRSSPRGRTGSCSCATGGS